MKTLLIAVLVSIGATALVAQPAVPRRVQGRVSATSVVIEQTPVGRIPVTIAVVGQDVVRVPGGRLGAVTLSVSELPRMRRGDLVSLEVVNGRAVRGSVLESDLRAGALLGPTWATPDVPYLVDPTNADVSADAALAAIRRAAEVWATEAHPAIRLVYAGPTVGATTELNYRNEVFFSPEANGGTIAVSYYWWTDAGQIVDSDIVFYDGGFQFFTGTSGCASGIYIEDPAVHEFGHTLGLAHSDVGEATMYPTLGWCSQAWRSLAPDDIATIEGLYPGQPVPPPDPDPVPPPPPPPAPIALSARGYKVKGVQHVQLTWSGATTAHVTVTRDGATMSTTANDGGEVFNLQRKGGGRYTFQVCEVSGAVCSAVVTVTF